MAPHSSMEPEPGASRLDARTRRTWAGSGAGQVSLPDGDRYEVIRALGEGGMGRVDLAIDHKLKRQVAIKRIKEEDAETRARFVREARTVARINHRNVVQVHDVGEDACGLYLVMEYVDGQTLARRIQDSGPMDLEQVLDLGRGLARALSAAHRSGAVHRDLKPGNVMLDAEGEPKVLDFGLAKAGVVAVDASLSLSLTGAVVGTLDYMAPEQRHDAKNVDHRADLFALGATLYCALTGTPPPRVIDPEAVPPAIWPVLRRLLAENPSQRYFSADETAEALAQCRLATSTQAVTTAAADPDQVVEGRCLKCHRSNPPEARFCRSCGAGLHTTCPACQNVQYLGHPICGQCGKRMGGPLPERPVPIAASAPDQVMTGEDRRKPNIWRVLGVAMVLLISAWWWLKSDAPGPRSNQVDLLAPVVEVPQSSVPNHPAQWSLGQDAQGRWAELTIGGVTQRMRWIAPGRFQMGSPANEPDRSSDETQHEVVLTQGFWLADTECTQALWQAVMGNNPSQFKGDGNRPVEQVSWNDCQEFLWKLAQKRLGITVRLPTEAEWEYACRAGTTIAYAGNLADLGWFTDNSGGQTHAVKTKKPNPWGLFDMHGNVWEWCGDWYGDYPAGSVTDPVGPAAGSRRVYRGGGWHSNARYCRSANRNGREPGYRGNGLGFRFCAQSTSPGGGAP